MATKALADRLGGQQNDDGQLAPPVKDAQKVILAKEYIPTKEDAQNWCMRVLRNSVKIKI